MKRLALPLLVGVFLVCPGRLWAQDKVGEEDNRGVKLVRKVGEAATGTAPQARGTGWAVIIGINEYSDRQGIGKLKFCENDARVLHQILTTTAGFPEKNCRLLLGSTKKAKERPTRSNMYSALTSWLTLAKKEDIALVYFAGHGVENQNKSYLLPQDARVTNPELTGMPLSHVKDFLRKSKAGRKVLIVDACHSGEGRDLGTMRTNWADDSKGLVCITSCDIGQKSYEYDEKYHGAFTWFIKQGLLGGADRDRDGFIRSSELNLYISDHLRRWAAKRGLSQSPRFVASVIGDPVLAWCKKEGTITPPTPAELKRDPNRFDLILLKTGKIIECEATEIGDRVRFKRRGITSSFPKSMVQQIQYSAGGDKREAAAARKERMEQAERRTQTATWKGKYFSVEVLWAKYYRKGQDAGRILFRIRVTNIRRDRTDITGVSIAREHWGADGIMVSPDRGKSQRLRAGQHFGILSYNIPQSCDQKSEVFMDRPSKVSLVIPIKSDKHKLERAKFRNVGVIDAEEE